ncbi:MAG: hypothetical protein IJ003_04870 [Candidatus Gastranaerophilales bacterium]|nr:hypothetical protein [Candidatus Gastranaerophilales bacterium]
MTYVSPLLNSYLNNKTNKLNHHDKVYEDLKKHANDVKPNEAKAKLVKRGPVTDAFNAIKDTGKDCANFVKAVRTGKLSDNNLGRINDLGLKLGAALIAVFLAGHAKTKTDAIKQFVCGGGFLAAMTLWPKLFINLPARLVHGFNIDQKYINAQGDKKDFFLDNQFLPWDAFSKEELEKIGKRTGIDYNSENGEEKIKRKMQKTALQNRTLWMATAGFATPLGSAMLGKAVGPKIQEAVTKHDFEQAKDLLENPEKLEAFIAKAKPDNSGVKALNKILNSNNGKMPDAKYFKSISEKLQVSELFPRLLSEDESKIISGIQSIGLEDKLKSLYEVNATVSKNGLADLIANAKLPIFSADMLLTGAEDVTIDKTTATNILASLGDNISISSLRTLLKSRQVADADIEKFIATLEVDDSSFREKIKEFAKGPLAQAKGRIKAYLKIINPIAGSTAESMATKEITDIMLNYADALGIDEKTLAKAKSGTQDASKNILQDLFVNFFKKQDTLPIDERTAKYTELLNTLYRSPNAALTEAMDKAGATENIARVVKTDGDALLEAILGGTDKQVNLEGVIKQSIRTKKVDIDAIRLKGLLCANMERRIAAGEFKGVEDIVRAIIYDGNISSLNNKLEVHEPEKFADILKQMFNRNAFQKEKEVCETIGEQVETIHKTLFKIGDDTVKNLTFANFSSRIKEILTSRFNDKAWMKKFGTMSAVLVAVTLLAQPFFGKIKKEYPEKTQGGAK